MMHESKGQHIGKTPSFHLFQTSVDAKHHGVSLSERWNVTWVGNNSMYTLNYNSPNFVCNDIVQTLVCRYASIDD